LDKLKTIVNGCRAYHHKNQKMLYDNYRAFALKTIFRYIYNCEEPLEITNDGFVKFFLLINLNVKMRPIWKDF
jgi:RNA polymerase sigma-70 factor (ECF subfamily)